MGVGAEAELGVEGGGAAFLSGPGRGVGGWGWGDGGCEEEEDDEAGGERRHGFLWSARK